MKYILDQWEMDDVQNIEDGEEEDEDEVSRVYYGSQCNCSENSQCRSKKCICYLRDERCGINCHLQTKLKCKNK